MRISHKFKRNLDYIANLGYTVNLIFFPNPLYKHKILNFKDADCSTLKNISTYYLPSSSSILLNVLLLNSSQQNTHFENGTHWCLQRIWQSSKMFVCVSTELCVCPRAELLVGIPWFCAKVHWKWQEHKNPLIALPLNGLSLYIYWQINYFTLKWLRHYGWIIVHKHLVKLATTDEDNLTFCLRITALYSSGLEVVTCIKKFSSFWLYHIKIL